LIASASSIEAAGAVAIMVAAAFVLTDLVAIVKVAVVAPGVTTTLSGTLARGDLDVSEILYPDFVAGPLIVSVPVAGVPPTTVGDESMKEVS
jgi:hypothetical protein